MKTPINQEWKELETQVISCQRCPRLVAWREEVAITRRRAYRDWNYWGKPVPGFGDYRGRVLIVGLAPGAHGANRTGRMFTGDGSGDFLFKALHRVGFASQPEAHDLKDGLQLTDIFISAVCRCAPPANKPTAGEIKNCLPYLEREFDLMTDLEGIVTLGQIAFDYTLRMLRSKGYVLPGLRFAHGSFHHLSAGLPWLISSFHPSRQNTQTGRLTTEMFGEIWRSVAELLRI